MNRSGPNGCGFLLTRLRGRGVANLGPAEMSQLDGVRVALAGRDISLPSLVRGRVRHVDRLESEHRLANAADATSWTVWDYIAALLIRDFAEEAVTSLAESVQPKVRAWISEPDEKLRSFTRPDSSGLFARFAADVTEDM